MTVGDVIRAEGSFANIEKLGTAGLNELDAKVSQLLAISHSEANALISSPNNQPPVLTNSKTSLIDPLMALPEAVQILPLDRLHLEENAHDALIAANITTIGELNSLNSSLTRAIRVLPANALGSINGALIALRNSVTQENTVDWFLYWKDQGIQLIPTTCSSSTPFEEVLRGLPTIIEEVLMREHGNKQAAIIIANRLGLEFEAKLKLGEIGSALGGISGERVRQIEEKALRVLREVFVEQHYRGRSYHIHPHIHMFIQKIRDIIEAAPNKLVLETKLQDSLWRAFNINVNTVKAPLILILSLVGVQRIEFDYPNAIPAWGYVEPGLRRRLENWLKRLDDLLTRETPLPFSEFKILTHLNRKVKKSEVLLPIQLEWLIDLCNTVERCEGGSVRGKFEYLKGRGNQVERLLAETNRPMSLEEVLREINHRLVSLGQHKITKSTLSNQIVGEGRFVPIGRSGQWGLKSWPDINTKSVLTLIEECLITYNKPATIDEIFTYVLARRTVKRRSVSTYLHDRKEIFAKIGLTTWGLAKWSDTAGSDTWGPERIAAFVAAIFKRNKVTELDYKIIKEALMKEAGINAHQAQGLLNHSPVIKTRNGTKWGERIAIFQPNYKNMLAQAKTSKTRRGVDQRQQIGERVHNILDGAPDKQMPMADLIRDLQEQFDISEPSLSGYIKRMNSIDLIGPPNSQKKICRVNGPMDSLGAGTLRDRVNKGVRAILEAAPNKQLSYRDLMNRLQKEHRYSEDTLYRYIKDLDYVERLNIPNSSAKVCRLKDEHAAVEIRSDTLDNRADELIQQLRALQTGDGKAYEGIVKNILEYCFHGEFDFTPFKVQEQVASHNGKRIRDFIIDNRNPKVEFWRDLKYVRKVEKILFDTKNYQGPITYSEITSTLRYLRLNKAFGNFIIIISRRGVRDLEESIEAYSAHDEIVLFLNDEDLIAVINLKREGKSPSALIDQKYHEFLGKT